MQIVYRSPDNHIVRGEEFEGIIQPVGYRVTTLDLKSLGLRHNPNILTYPIGEWFILPEDQIREGKGDWGGIWVARTPGRAREYKKYMKTEHQTETRIFKATLADILCVTDSRIKTSGIFMRKEM